MIKADIVCTVKLHYERERDENTPPFDEIKETVKENVKEFPRLLKELLEENLADETVVTVEEVESILTED